MAKNKKTKKTEPVDEVETDDEEETEELEDDDTEVDDDEADEAPAKKGKAEEVEFGASDLAAHLSEKTGKKITPRELRAFIRKMAREDNPRVQREVIAGNRSRYNWEGGLKNPEVKAIIKAVTAGELQESKNEALQKLKADKAAKKAAAGDDDAPAKKKGKKGKKTKVVEPDDDEVEDVDDDDIEIDEDED